MIRRILPVFSVFLAVFLLLPVAQAAERQQKHTLLIVGDSLSAGYGIPRGQEWVALLQQSMLEKSLQIQVVNASISGDTTAGGLSRIKPLLQRESPKWVLIELGGNDGLRGMSLSAMKSNLQSMVDAVKQHGAQPMLLGIKIPPNYGSKYRTRFEQVFVDVAASNDVALLPFLLDEVGGVEHLMQADRIHPNTIAQPIIAQNVWRFLKPILQVTGS
jgi:acyl-CoA thioesterase-1